MDSGLRNGDGLAMGHEGKPDGRMTPAPEALQKRRKRKFLVADLLCGAGGSSTGAKNALEAMGYEMVLTALNHWDKAIATHSKNHPGARHFLQDVSAARPAEIVPEGKLDLLLASPTCTHHSRARGGKPTSDQKRSDPWHIITWLTELRVKRMIIENVPEFTEWGPVNANTGKPLKSRKGEYFRSWVRAIEGLGYKVDWRIINCADHGDATTRVRFFLMARNDGKKIFWPAPEYSKHGVADMFGNGGKKWRAARTCIDWSHKGQSIFMRKRPLAEKTMARIMAGAERYNWPEPYLVILRQNMGARSVDEPLPTITAGGRHIALAETSVEPFTLSQASGGTARDTGEPVQTICAAGAVSLVEGASAPFILPQHSQGALRTKHVDEPVPTITTIARHAVVEGQVKPAIVNMKGRSNMSDVDDPLPTITAQAGHLSVADPVLLTVAHGVDQREKNPHHRRVHDIDSPMPTVTAGGIQQGIAEPVLVTLTGGNRPKHPQSTDEPLRTITTRNGVGLADPVIAPYYGSGSGKTGKTVNEPLDTVTAKARFALAEPTAEPVVIQTDQTGSRGCVRSVDEPVHTIVTKQNAALIQADSKPFLVPQFGEREGQAPRTHDVDAPLPAVTGHGAGALTEGLAEPALQRVYDFAEYEIALQQGRVFDIDGVPHIFDIRFRMLQWRELARATSFDDEEAEYEFVGNKTEITKQIGNAVPVRTAKALVAAICAY